MFMESFLNKLKNVLLILIGFFYILGGIYVIKAKWFLTDLDENTSLALGIILFLYGVFRVYRAIKIQRKEWS
jgi:multisubunit Na+/H+ antiporter MnhG subunit